MKTILLFWIAVVSIALNTLKVQAQDSTKSCRVLIKGLEGTYNGECKDGIANGKGEAKGMQSYTGIFKNGKPNGLGTYVYSDIVYYKGNFQDGLREGKGELHYLLQGKPDSVINGYWSADEYRGKKYTTYTYRSNFR